MFVLELFAYAGIGVIAGLLAGLLGISGGIVTVPLLMLVYSLFDFPQATLMHMAIGTSLAAMVLNTFSAAWEHHRKKAVLWGAARQMAPGIFLGSISGALVAHELSSVLLEALFGLFACSLALYMLRSVQPQKGNHPLPGRWSMAGIGYAVSGLANVLGIGGGIVTVPLLMAFKVPERKAIATSAATGCMVTLLGAVFYLFFGLQEHTAALPGAVGYLYLPAFLTIGSVSFFVAPIGARITHNTSPTVLRRLFAAALFATGLLMLFG